MGLHKLFAAAFILCVTSYCGEWKFALGASNDDESLPCVNGTGCERSVDEAEEAGSEALLKRNYSIEKNNAKLQEQRLTNISKAAFTPFKDDYDEPLFGNKTTYLTYMKVNSDSESFHIPLCKPKKEENYLYDCSKITSAKFACIGPKEGKIAECDSFVKTDYPSPVCAERSSNKFIICGRDSSYFLCFPSNGKKSPIQRCFNKERHICLFGGGIFKECQNLKTVSEKKETGSTFKESPQGNRSERKEIVLIKDREIRNLCIDGSDSKLLPCSKDPPSSSACINPIDGKIELCEDLENINELGVSICIQSSTSRLLTCEKNSEVNLCYSPRKERSKIKPCSILSKMICVSKDGALTICSPNLTADNVSEQEKHKFKDIVRAAYIIDGRKERKPDDMYNMKKWNLAVSRKYVNLTYLCTVGTEEKEIVHCETNASTYACLGTESGRITECNTLRQAEISVPVCVDDSTYGLMTCGKFSSVKLCVSDNSRPVFRICKRNERSACLKNGSLQYCSEKRLISRSAHSTYLEEYKFSKGHPSHEKELLYKPRYMEKELCVLNQTAREFAPCKSVSSSRTLACFGFQDGTIRSCEGFQKYELVYLVCYFQFKRPPKEREVYACGRASHVSLCYSPEGKEPLEPCGVIKRRVCLDSNNILSSCPHVDLVPTLKYPLYLSMAKDVLSNKQKLCLVDATESKFQPCTGKKTEKKACFGYEIAAIRACLNFTDDELVSRVCLEKSPQNKLVTCDPSSIPLCIRITAGEQKIFSCKADEIHACLDDEGRIISCNGLEKAHLTENLDEKFIRLQCENCSIDNTFRVLGEHPDVLPEYERLIFLN